MYNCWRCRLCMGWGRGFWGSCCRAADLHQQCPQWLKRRWRRSCRRRRQLRRKNPSVHKSDVSIDEATVNSAQYIMPCSAPICHAVHQMFADLSSISLEHAYKASAPHGVDCCCHAEHATRQSMQSLLASPGMITPSLRNAYVAGRCCARPQLFSASMFDHWGWNSKCRWQLFTAQSQSQENILNILCFRGLKSFAHPLQR